MAVNSLFSSVPSKLNNTLAQSSTAEHSQNEQQSNSPESVVVDKRPPAAIVTTLSNEGLAALANVSTSDPIDVFLTEQGESLYEITIKSLRVHPEDLATKLDDRSLSQAEQTDAQNALTERELNAFAKYARQSPPDMKKYLEKYVEYLDTLSPAELQSSRYKGQRALAVTAYQQIARDDGGEAKDLSSTKDPILALFEAIREQEFNIKDRAKLRERYEALFPPSFGGDNDVIFRAKADQALERFDSVQRVIDAAREGDHAAFVNLEQLTSSSLTIDQFLAYANRLTSNREP